MLGDGGAVMHSYGEWLDGTVGPATGNANTTHPQSKGEVLRSCFTNGHPTELGAAGVVVGGGTTTGLLVGGKIADAYAQSLVRSAFGAGDASAFTWERGVALVSNPEVQRLATAGRGLARLGGYVALATAAIEILELRHPWVCYWTHTGP